MHESISAGQDRLAPAVPLDVDIECSPASTTRPDHPELGRGTANAL